MCVCVCVCVSMRVHVLMDVDVATCSHLLHCTGTVHVVSSANCRAGVWRDVHIDLDHHAGGACAQSTHNSYFVLWTYLLTGIVATEPT